MLIIRFSKFLFTHIYQYKQYFWKKNQSNEIIKNVFKTGKSDGKTIESCRVKKLRIFATKPMKTGYWYENHVQ